ncbi:hypothetical protein IQ269_25530 [Tychonema sp. LEGE 07199]|nr:hypothetical protein [Tychonema sp. LEGE 07199]
MSFEKVRSIRLCSSLDGFVLNRTCIPLTGTIAIADNILSANLILIMTCIPHYKQQQGVNSTPC